MIRSAFFPAEYGRRGNEDELLPWSFVEERLLAAPNYWIATTRPDGRPHVRPIDAVWVLGSLCFGGSPETRWIRNIAENSATTFNLPSTTEVVILEGLTEYITDTSHPLAAASTAATRQKYPQYFTPEALAAMGSTSPEDLHAFWAFHPRLVYAWTLAKFPSDATRWTIEDK